MSRPSNLSPDSDKAVPVEAVVLTEEAARTLELALNAYPFGNMLVDEDGEIVLANRAMEAMAGEEPAARAGKRCHDVLKLEEGALPGCPLEQTVRSGEAMTLDFAIPEKETWVRATTYLTDFVRQGGKRILLHQLVDITERRQLQQQVARANRMASVGTLAAGVAHEINNPLTYAMLNLEELLSAHQRRGEPTSESELLSQALNGCKRVRDIVDALKTFSRAEDDRRARVDVNEVLEAALQLAQNQLRHRATMEKDLGQLRPAYGNAGRLSQVFLNLLINAVQALDESKTPSNRITIGTRLEGDEVVCTIRDNGRGIHPDQLPHIFDPFYTSKPVGLGAGLGLSICHEFITAMGGTIQATSAQGEGACFTIRLPAVDHAAAEDEPVLPVAVPRDQVAGPACARVLVVDDEEMITKSIRRILKRKKHKVTVALGGREAVEALERGAAFDLVLTDLAMPDMTGMDLFRWLQQNQPDLCPHVVFMTGGAFTPSATRFLKENDNRCLAKPVESRELLALAREAANRGSGEQ